MSKRKTTQEFIEQATQLHKDFYDYSKVTYVNALTKVVINCPIHGSFEQKPNSHLQGNGCPSCGVEKAHKATKQSTDTFKYRAKKVHGSLYDYSNTIYTDSGTKLTISCKLHGDFKQTPLAHLRGQGCPTCGKLKSKVNQTPSTEDFIKKAEHVHKDKYTYQNSTYTLSRNNITITCSIHGDFSQIAQSHLAGQGCPKCALENAGWSYTKWEQQGKRSKYFDSFKLYLVECWSDNERFLKIGKTFSTVGRRFQDKQTMPYQWKLIKQLEGAPRYISELEHELHKEYKLYSYTPNKIFGGNSECFSLEVIPLIQECHPYLFK